MGADGFFLFERVAPVRQGAMSLLKPDAMVADQAAFGFCRAFPGQSARSVLLPSQLAIAMRSLLVLGLAGLIAPLGVLRIVMWFGLILFAAILAFRIALLFIGCLPARSRPKRRASDCAFPVYTILVALKDEARQRGAIVPVHSRAGLSGRPDRPETAYRNLR
tara:strand:- start:3432 stop:3920 length:489 start_codon:yes stop_codon:yes gene_type:complete